jgi:hypothetical protein
MIYRPTWSRLIWQSRSKKLGLMGLASHIFRIRTYLFSDRGVKYTPNDNHNDYDDFIYTIPTYTAVKNWFASQHEIWYWVSTDVGYNIRHTWHYIGERRGEKWCSSFFSANEAEDAVIMELVELLTKQFSGQTLMLY